LRRYKKAADLGCAASKVTFGSILLRGDCAAGVPKDEVRGFELVRQAFAEGCSLALNELAR
jgi:TPR repeat protein